MGFFIGRSDKSLIAIAHEIRDHENRLIEQLARFRRYAGIDQRLAHAHDPLVAFGRPDREGLMRMGDADAAGALRIERRTAQPAAQEFEQLFPDGSEIRAMHGADRCRLGVLVHDLVEPIDDFAETRFAADHFIRKDLSPAVTHRGSPCTKGLLISSFTNPFISDWS